MQHTIYNLCKTAVTRFFNTTGLLSLIFILTMFHGETLFAQNNKSGANPEITPQGQNYPGVDNMLEQRVRETLKNNGQTLRFMENKGQVNNPEVLYYFEGKNGAVYIEKNRIRFVAIDDTLVQQTAAIDAVSNGSLPKKERKIRGTHTFTIYMDGANPASVLELGESFNTRYNYFQSTDSKDWVTGVNAAKDLTIKDVYKGIDLRLYSTSDGALEFDWIMQPGADYNKVKMHFEGQDRLRVDEHGSLDVGLRFKDINFKLPESYQVTKSAKLPVSFSYNKLNNNTIGFSTQSTIDPRYPVVIDPVLTWGTFMDGNLSNFDQYLFAIQVDPTDGMVYCAGSSNQNIPTASAPYTANGYLNSVTGFTNNSNGVHVAVLYRVNSSGTQLVDLTLYGPNSVSGATNGLAAYALSLSPTRVFIGGFTEVSIPTAGTPFDGTQNGTDGYVAVFSRDLGSLVYATYLGSTGNETRGVTSIRALSDNSFAVGLTAAAALPAAYISAGVASGTFAGGTDMYIAKFGTLNTLSWGTYVGGTSNEVFNDLEVLADGRVAFAGYGSGTLTEVNSAAGSSSSTDNDGIVGVLNSNGTAFNYLDKIGGAGDDQILDIEIVGSTLYWTGSASSGFPTSSGVYDTSHNGGTDVVVGSVSTAGGSGSYKATFYGGGGNDIGSCLRLVTQTACNGVSNSFLLVFGTSSASGAVLPTTNINGESFFKSSYSGGLEIFFAGFSQDLVSLTYGTLIGGASDDYLGETGSPRGANHLFVNGANIYCGTTTHSATHLPVIVSGGFDLSKSNGGNDSHVLFSIQFSAILTSDYGDAPASYGSPSHILSCSTLRIGSLVDSESNPLPGTQANGDDLDNLDDEDGISSLPVFSTGGPQNISVTVNNLLNSSGNNATLYAWIDLNSDGQFSSGEFTSVSVANGFSGSKTLTWSGVTVSGSQTAHFLRIRLTTNVLNDNAGTASVDERSTAGASDGEVEDYLTVLVPAVPAWTMTKTSTTNPNHYSAVGNLLTYSIVLQNTGNVSISNVVVTDPGANAGSIIYQSGDVNSNNIMEVGESWTYSAAHTVTQANLDAALYTNTATATGTPTGGTLNPATANATIPSTGANPQISLVKTGTPHFGPDGIPQVGETITYAFAVTNSGNVTLTNVTVSDPLVTVTGGPISSLAPGGTNSNTFTATYILTQANINAGTFTNMATATGTPPFGQNVTGTGQYTQTLTAASSISMTKTGTLHMDVVAPNGVVNAGDQITYIFTVTNIGNTTLTNVTINDPLVTVIGSPIASLAPGATNSSNFTATYTLTQANINAGTFTNVATAAGNPPTGPAVTGSDGDTQALPKLAGIDLVKSGTPNFGADGIPQSGETISYAFMVTNTGNVTLTNVMINDPLVSVTGGPIASLAPGAVNNSTFTATYILTQNNINSGSLTNTATVTAKDPQNVTITDVDSHTQPLNQAVSIDLDKTGNPNFGPDGIPQAGETITYTFTITNNSNVTLTNITLSDPQVTVLGGPLASLAPGQVDNSTFTATYTLTQANINSGSFVNTATVSGKDPSNNTVTHTDSHSQPLVAASSISMTKTGTLHTNIIAPNGIANAGDQVTYVFTVTNTGNTTLTNVTVSDPLATITGGPLASLAPGATNSSTFTAVYTLTQANIDAGTFTNTATATGIPPSGPPVTGSDNDTQTLPASSSISMTKTGTLQTNIVAPGGIANAGDQVTYVFTVTNTGNTTLTNVTINDPLASVSGGPITSLAPGSTDNSTYTATYTLTQADINAGAFTNTATSTGTPPTGPPVTGTDGDTQLLPASSSVSMTKTGTLHTDVVAPNGIANAGDQVTYAFTVTNTGNTTLTNVTINDPLASVTGGPISSLAPGVTDNSTFTATYTLTQADIDAGTFTNTATSTGIPPIGPPVTSSDGDTQILPSASSMSMNKTGTLHTDVVSPNGIANAGDQVTYVFTVTNTGNTTLTNVTIMDPLAAVIGGPIASLAPGATDNSTFTATYTLTQADIDAGTFSNTATSSGIPPTGPPVTGTDGDTQTLPSASSISMTKTGTLHTTIVAPNSAANAGDQVTYVFSVTNTGNTTLTNITMSDPLATIVGGPIPSLAPGATDNVTFAATYTLNQADIDAGTFTNVATVHGIPPVGSVVTATDGDTQTLPELPGIDLVKSGTPHFGVDGLPQAGETITYSFTVTNTGNVTLTNIIVADPFVSVNGGPIASLAPGSVDNTTFTANYTLTQNDINAGFFTNTAIVTGKDPQNQNVTDNDSHTQPLNQAISIDLDKTGDPNFGPDGIPQAGETISYTFNITNTSNVTLTNITVSDPLVTVIGGPIASLLPGQSDNTTFSATYVLTQADIDAGLFVNIATVTGKDPSNNDVTGTDSHSQPLPAASSISMTKTGTLNAGLIAPNGIANAGDQVTYAFTVTNTGNTTLTNVMIADPLATILGGPISSLAPGATDNSTFTATYTLTQADVDAGTFTNTATSTGIPPSGTPVTASDGDTQTLPAASSISMTKTGTLQTNFVAPVGVANAGDQISYVFSVTNTGNTTLTNVTISDPLATIAGGPIVSLAPGETDNSTFTANYMLTQADIDAGTFTNVATAHGTPPTGPAVTGSDNDTQALPAASSISLIKTGTLHLDVVSPNGVANAGDQVTYVFSLTNTGNTTLTNVTINDPLATITGGPIAMLAPGETDNFTFTATYSLTQANIDAGLFTNVATAHGNPPLGPPVNGTDDDTQVLDHFASIDLVKSGTPNFGPDGLPQAGETISYSFTVTNNGNVTLTNVTVNDPLVAVTGGPVASMAPGAVDHTSFTATYILTQADINAGSFTNTAVVTGHAPQNQTVTDQDSHTQPLNQTASIDLDKTGFPNFGPDGLPQAGETITYVFTITNNSNVTLTNITLSDPLVTVTGGPIASLAPGQTDNSTFSATYILTQANIDAGIFVNTATVTGKDPSNNPVAHSDSHSQPLSASPSISLIKTGILNTNVIAPNGIANAGDKVTYVFTVTNTGNTTLTNVTITDPLATIVGGPIASLAPGATDNSTFTATYTLSQANIDAGTFTNVATAHGNPPAGPPVSGSDDDTQSLPAASSISMTKTGTLHKDIVTPNNQPNAGDKITYVFTVTNTGNTTLTNVTISDPLATITGGPIASLAPGATDNSTFTATYTLSQADINAGTFTNIATVTANPPAGDVVNGTDDDTQVLDHFASIDLVKSGTPNFGPDGLPQAGETISYSFTVTNNGNVTLTNVTINDPLVAVTGGPVASMAPGAVDHTTFTATYILTQADINAGSFTNTAVVTGHAPQNQTVTDQDSHTQPLNQASSIDLDKTGFPNFGPDGLPQAGETITYVFTITNNSNVTLTNITLNDPLVTVTGGPIASMAPGQTDNSTFSATYVLSQANIDAGIFVNTATVTGKDPSNNPVTHSDSHSQPLPASPSISLIKTGTLNTNVIAPNGIANAGDKVTYVFTVTNTGNTTLTNVTVTDPLASIVGGPIASLAPGATDNSTFTATYTLSQANIDAGTFTNVATAHGNPPAGQPVSGTDDDTQVLDHFASIDLVKSGTPNFGPDGLPQAGETISYSFTVTNNGNVTLTNVTVNDPLVAVTGGPVASMAPGAVDHTTFTAIYILTQADINAGSFTNTAVVTGHDPQNQTVTDQDSHTQPLNQAVSIDLDKTGFPNFGPDGLPQAGETITYVFTITNNSNVTLTNITLNDPLVTVTGGPIASMAPGQTDNSTFSATYVLTQANIDAGIFVNTATVTGKDPSNNPVTHSDSHSQPLPASPSISMTKTGILNTNVIVPNSIANAGDKVTYVFTVTNTGNTTLTNVTITDPLASIVGGPIASLAPGATDNSTFTATYTLSQANIDAGTFTNVATAHGNPPAGPPVSGSDDDTQSLPAASSISMTKTGTLHKDIVAPNNLANAGDNITYVFTVTNTGNTTLTNVTISDPMATIIGGPIASLAPGATDNITFTGIHTLSQADINAGTFTNVATVHGTPPTGPVVTGSDDDTQNYLVCPEITSQPATSIICAGGTASLAIGVAEGSNPVNYQWQVSSAGCQSGFANIPGATNASYATMPLNATGYFKCLVFPVNQNCSMLESSCTQVTVNPVGQVNQPSNQVVCNGSGVSVNFSTSNPGGTTSYAWTNSSTSIGLAASGNGNIPLFSAINTGTATVEATINVTPTFTNSGVSCTGSTKTFTITVNPAGQVNALGNQVVCNGSLTSAVNFTTINTDGVTTYSWTNDHAGIGLASSGTGNIPAFIATNNGTVPVVATIIVTPIYQNNSVSCSGTSKTFTITVNPTGQVNATGNQAVCDGSLTAPVNFSTINLGGVTTYSWTNSNSTIGLGSAGSGNIPSFTALNSGPVAVVATITVTPHYSSNGQNCDGVAQSFSYTVTPKPILVTHPQSTCTPNKVDLTAPGVTAGSSLSGATLSYWLNAGATLPMPNPTSAGAGTYYIKAATVGGCFDIKPVTVTINPLPTVYTGVGSGSYCAGGSGLVVGISGSQIGVNYTLFLGLSVMSSTIPGTGSAISFGVQSLAGTYWVLAENTTTHCINRMFDCVYISINPLLPVSLTINPSANPVNTGAAVTFTANPLNEGPAPVYQWKVNGLNAGTNQPTFTYIPVNGDEVKCILVSNLPCASGNPASSNTVEMMVNGVPVNSNANGIVVNGHAKCFNALQTLVVAGGGTSFIVQNGGSATMVAGHNIVYLPGTSVLPGGYMHGYITTANQYCGQQAPSLPTVVAGENDPTVSIQTQRFVVYPNPTTGNFTLEQKGDHSREDVKVEIYGMRGERVLTGEMPGERKHEFSISGFAPGLYFVKVVSGDSMETIKLIKTQ